MGEITHAEAILVSVHQLTGAWVARPTPITPPTIDWVVETGSPLTVAIVTHIPAERSAIMAMFIVRKPWGTMPSPTVFMTL